jgi:hypothetical protein
VSPGTAVHFFIVPKARREWSSGPSISGCSLSHFALTSRTNSFLKTI